MPTTSLANKWHGVVLDQHRAIQHLAVLRGVKIDAQMRAVVECQRPEAKVGVVCKCVARSFWRNGGMPFDIAGSANDSFGRRRSA